MLCNFCNQESQICSKLWTSQMPTVYDNDRVSVCFSQHLVDRCCKIFVKQTEFKFFLSHTQRRLKLQSHPAHAKSDCSQILESWHFYILTQLKLRAHQNWIQQCLIIAESSDVVWRWIQGIQEQTDLELSMKAVHKSNVYMVLTPQQSQRLELGISCHYWICELN